MEITILGSGTATPNLERNASGIAIRAGKQWMLIDMGPGILRRLCEARIDVNVIETILITHFHADHVSDLVPFLFASNYAYGPVRQDPFYVVGPRGLEQFYNTLVQAYGHWIVPTNNRMIMREMDPDALDTLQIGDLTILSRPAAHSYPCLSYRIDTQGLSVTISGDTDISDELVTLASGSHVLICECSMPDALKSPGHLGPSEAGQIAARAGVSKLVLTHFYPPCDDIDVIREAAKFFPGEIVKARDLMAMEL